MRISFGALKKNRKHIDSTQCERYMHGTHEFTIMHKCMHEMFGLLPLPPPPPLIQNTNTGCVIIATHT